MGNVHEPATKVKQLKRELEHLRREIGHRHDDVVERMRETETGLLHAAFEIEQRRTDPPAT